MKKRKELRSKYKKPTRTPKYIFSLDHFYFFIDKGQIMIYTKQKIKEKTI